MHGMSGADARSVLRTVEDGDYYVHNRGKGLQVEAVHHNPKRRTETRFAVLAINSERTGVYLRTFLRSTNMTHSKFKGGKRLRWVSGVDYFWGMV